MSKYLPDNIILQNNLIMNYKNILIVVFYSILSLLLTSYILGIDNLSFTSNKWLNAHDVTSDIVSWKFFKNDIWRFPLGSNPTYGMDIGSGIAFSGSIPILAIIYKRQKINILNNKVFYLGSIISFFWLIRSFIQSSCFLFPIKISCINTSWSL